MFQILSLLRYISQMHIFSMQIWCCHLLECISELQIWSIKGKWFAKSNRNQIKSNSFNWACTSTFLNGRNTFAKYDPSSFNYRQLQKNLFIFISIWKRGRRTAKKLIEDEDQAPRPNFFTLFINGWKLFFFFSRDANQMLWLAKGKLR